MRRVDFELDEDETDFLDSYARNHELSGRSDVVRAALERLRREEQRGSIDPDERTEQYRLASTEWEESGEAATWDTAVAEGLQDDRWPHPRR